MSTTTTNYGLTKPATTDSYDISVPNANMDAIDTALKNHDTSLAAKAPLSSPALTGTPTAPTPAAGTNTTQLANMAAIYNYLYTLGAWLPLPQAFAYSSPTSMIASGDLTGQIGPDFKMRLVQSGATKYFNVTSVSYSSSTGQTTITLDGLGTYTLANAAISSPYYSTAFCPLGWPSAKYIVTSGASGNSHYTKYSDGTMEEWGWGYFQGSGNVYTNNSITFPVAFVAIQECLVGALGYCGSVPSSIMSLTGQYGGNEATIFARMSSLSAFILEWGGTTSTSNYYGYTWHAKGTWK